MEIEAIQRAAVAVVSIQGSVDAMTSRELTEFLLKKIEDDQVKMVIDLGGVEFMSSAGLRAVLIALREARSKGGDLRLAGAQPGVEKVLKMSGFNMILKTLPTVDEALNDF
jgi:anti-sigma B factor antagonist